MRIQRRGGLWESLCHQLAQGMLLGLSPQALSLQLMQLEGLSGSAPLLKLNRSLKALLDQGLPLLKACQQLGAPQEWLKLLERGEGAEVLKSSARIWLQRNAQREALSQGLLGALWLPILGTLLLINISYIFREGLEPPPNLWAHVPALFGLEGISLLRGSAWLFAALLIILLVMGLWAPLRRLLRYLPGLSSLYRRQRAAEAAALLAAALQEALPLPHALELAGLSRAAAALSGGLDLPCALQADPLGRWLRPYLQTTGPKQLQAACLQAATLLNEEVQLRRRRGLIWLQQLMTLLLVFLVAGLLFSIYPSPEALKAVFSP